MTDVEFDRYKCLTFDVVGTLIDFEAGIVDFFKSIEATQSPETVLAAFGEAESLQQNLTPTIPFTQMLAPIYLHMAKALALPVEHEHLFKESIPNWPAFPDSIEALKKLKKRFRLVALTNSDNWALQHMQDTLESPFDDTVTAEDVGVNKPDPQVFAYCAGRQSAHGVQRNEILHVAQSQYHDIGIAMQLGYTTCWIERRRDQAGYGATPTPDVKTEPDLHFSTLIELAEFVGG